MLTHYLTTVLAADPPTSGEDTIHPPVSLFRDLFPQFASVTDEQYAFWATQAVLVTGPLESCLGDRFDLATMLVTAHYLTQQGIGTGTESQMAAQGMGGFSRIKSGSLELQRDSTSRDASMGDWGTTAYGQRAFAMMRPCFSGPRVTGTGALCVGGFNGFSGRLRDWNF